MQIFISSVANAIASNITHFWQALQSLYSYSIAAEPKNSALFHKAIAQIVLLVTCIFLI